MGSPLSGRLAPGLVVALVKIALIGTWSGRTFLDDDADLSDIADFTPVESLPTAALDRSRDPAEPAPNSVAA